MRQAIALSSTTAILLIGYSPTSSAADTPFAQLLLERHDTQEGYDVDVAVTETADHSVLAEATVQDPATGDIVDVWTDGDTVWWDGTQDGELVHGSADAGDMVDLDAPGDGPQAFICLHPVGALVCIAAVAVLASGCGYGFSCSGDDPGGNPSNYPSAPGGQGGGQGGGGDGEEPGSSGGDGDGDG